MTEESFAEAAPAGLIWTVDRCRSSAVDPHIVRNESGRSQGRTCG